MKKSKVWMAVTSNELSLPIAVAEDPGTLADMIGVRKETIISEASRFKDKTYRDRYPRYVKVEVDDD